jgi:hypothetical protein
VPAWVRLQPPPPRTAQTDFPYAALLSAARHGLCGLSTRSAFVRSPIADSVVSEEPEPFMEPRRTPPLPAEAAIRLISLRHDVDPPPQVLQTNGRRNHAAPASHVVGGRAEQQVLRSTGITPLPRYCGPLRHLLAVRPLPRVPGYGLDMAPPLSRGARKASPVARPVLVTVPSLSPRRSVPPHQPGATGRAAFASQP